MKLLFLNHNVAYSGGTFFRALHLATALGARGHAVTLLTISPHRRWRFERRADGPVCIVETPDLFWGVGRTGWDPWDVVRRVGYLRRQAWDIVHAWDTRPAVIVPALRAARRSRPTGGRLIIDWCDWWGRGGTQAERTRRWMRLVAPVETWFEERFRTAADGQTVISRALRERATALGASEERVRMLPQGCPPPILLPGRAEARAALDLRGDAPVVVALGALTRSDAALLFATLERLFTERPDCRFVLIGRHRAHLPDWLRAAPQFREAGFVPPSQLTDYMAACDALLVPLADTLASQARWPSRVNPFLAAGRTVVVTHVGDLPDLLANRGAGIVAAPDPDALAGALQRVLADPDRRCECERSGKALAEGELAWSRLAAGVEGFYQEVLAMPSLTPARATVRGTLPAAPPDAHRLGSSDVQGTTLPGR